MFIRSRRVVTPDGVQKCVLHIEGGKILSLLPYQSEIAGELVDVGDLVVSPGIVDPHVHINEPGRTEWEGFATATRAAAAGGVTTLVDMPLNCIPATTTSHALHAKIATAAGKLHVDCGFHAGLVPENANELGGLLGAGVLGVKAFLISSGVPEFQPVGEEHLRSALPTIRHSDLPLLVHAELASDVVHAPSTSHRYSDYLASRPRCWENDAVRLMIGLAEEYNCRVHIVHVSSCETLPLLERAKDRGVQISAETCPHYLFFSAEEIPEGATEYKCAPPIRERANNEALWNGLASGVLDCVVSDHSPSLPEMKQRRTGDFINAWGGIASLQLSFSVVWTAARSRGFGFTDVSRWMSANTSRLVGLDRRKGRIAAGYDADLVVWNPDETFVVDPSLIKHRHTLNPYAGCTLYGRVHATYLRGEKVFDGAGFSGPAGQIIFRT
ncbi:MAG TPA: allantoinase AllB [Bacteroidota bacterium]|nr:allantoinase AllB [Bacteroidota bacterium]